MPEPDRERAKQVIVELIKQAGGELVGATRLHNAFYAAHLYYAEMAPGYLTAWPMIKTPKGPGIADGEKLLQELEAAGTLRTEPGRLGPYPAKKHVLAKKTRAELPPVAVQAIKEAIRFVTDPGMAALSAQSRSWQLAGEGEELNIYIDLIPDDEYEARENRLNQIEKVMAAAHRPGASKKRAGTSRTRRVS